MDGDIEDTFAEAAKGFLPDAQRSSLIYAPHSAENQA
jgi:hypothetical protein